RDDHPHGWERWARFVTRRPLPSALVALVVLVALALPVRDLYLGQQDNGALPTSTEARRAYDGLMAGFGVGANGPLLVSVDLSKKPATAGQPAADPRLQGLRADIGKTSGVDAVTQPLVNDAGTAAVMTATPTTAPSDRTTERLIRRLRDDTIPAATKG